MNPEKMLICTQILQIIFLHIMYIQYRHMFP